MKGSCPTVRPQMMASLQILDPSQSYQDITTPRRVGGRSKRRAQERKSMNQLLRSLHSNVVKETYSLPSHKPKKTKVRVHAPQPTLESHRSDKSKFLLLNQSLQLWNQRGSSLQRLMEGQRNEYITPQDQVRVIKKSSKLRLPEINN